MANKFTRFLNGVGEGLTKPKGNMGDFRHASRLFLDDTFRLSPRTKYLFYVQFEFDKTALRSSAFSNKHSSEVGLLVKSSDLPKFNFDSVVKNQYNRKKIIYKQINYEPVNISLHDDSAGIVSAMWALYYGYYIADRNNPTTAFGATHLRPVSTPIDNFRYGMDNGITVPFFKSVSIYTMSRRRFLGYTLINPKIKSWNHGTVDYSAGDTLESQMSLEYESVAYTAGNVSFGNPKGFATLHYDAIPSPLSVAGGGVANLLGPGGVLDGLDSIFGSVSSGTAFGSVGGFLGTAIATINTYNNAKGLSKEGLKQEAVNILSNPNNVRTVVSTTSGIIGAVFPKSNNSATPTEAVQKNLTQQ
jgi:hypothetical protein